MTQINHGLDTEHTCYFYEQDFYIFSNFSSFTVVWKNIRFDTLEHAYHWEKFTTGSSHTATDRRIVQEMIRTAPSAHEAYQIAQRYKSIRRDDWDQVDATGIIVKVRIMFDLLVEKVDQHEYVYRKMRASGKRELVENSWRDSYWGWGPDRKGKNVLGKLWVFLRDNYDKRRTCRDELQALSQSFM